MNPTGKVKEVARAKGADLVGICSTGDLPEFTANIEGILKGVQRLVIIASRHSISAMSSANNQVRQHETIQTYQRTARAADELARFLEDEGFMAVACPAFIPIDMRDPNKGMRGDICWRTAAVRSGLGSFGENGLLVTEDFGSAVRLAGVLTTAPLDIDHPMERDLCDHCGRCVEACPAEALLGEGKVNKRKCGDRIFAYGFRTFRDFLCDVIEANNQKRKEIVNDFTIRELWQNFMTGCYYYCWVCQMQCPASKFQDLH